MVMGPEEEFAATGLQFIHDNEGGQDGGWWLLDSGATSHMSGNFKSFVDYQEFTAQSKWVSTAAGDRMVIAGKGNIFIQAKQENKETVKIKLINVLHVPRIIKNIISVTKITEAGYKVCLNKRGCTISGFGFEVKATGKQGFFLVDDTKEEESNHTESKNDITEEHTEIKDNKEKTEIHKNFTLLDYNESTKISSMKENSIIETTEPENWNEVKHMNTEERELWIDTMKEEIEKIEKAKAWSLVESKKEYRPISCRWTYKIKRDEKEKIVCLRARLVARGFLQRFGESYRETYAPVVKQQSIRIILGLMSLNNWKSRHCDISSAFLHSELEEDIFISKPPGPWRDIPEGMTLKLNKAIYGLKQAARVWYNRISQSLSRYGLTPGKTDPCIFSNIEHEKIIYVLLHVDDLLIVSNDMKCIKDLIELLRSEYELKDLGTVKCYLGIQVDRSREHNHITIHQKPLINKLVSEWNLFDGKTSSTPMHPEYTNFDYRKQSPISKQQEKFQSAVGVLLYISLGSRPDILLSTNLLGRVVSSPTNADVEELKKVIRYLKHTKEYSLDITMKKEPLLKVYSDSNWGGDIRDRKSTTGYCHFLGGSLVQWGTKKQGSVALSTTEAEYLALSFTTQETMWMISLLKDFNISNDKPVIVLCDNQSTIRVAEQESVSQRTKHIDIRHHFVRDMISSRVIQVEYCPTEIMFADIMTKPLPKGPFTKMRKYLGITISSSIPDNEMDSLDSDYGGLL